MGEVLAAERKKTYPVETKIQYKYNRDVPELQDSNFARYKEEKDFAEKRPLAYPARFHHSKG